MQNGRSPVLPQKYTYSDRTGKSPCPVSHSVTAVRDANGGQ